MPVKHTVLPGEGVTSVSADYGVLPDNVWNSPDNAALRQLRKQPELLLPGDSLVIPDRKVKGIDIPAGQPAKVVRKGINPTMNVRLLDANEQPRANEPYVAKINDNLVYANTDADGWVRQPVPPNVKKVTIMLKNASEKIEVNVAHLAPVQTTAGAQARLANLGYFPGVVDGKDSPATAAAIKKFQNDRGLPSSGLMDPATIKKLEEVHGS